MIQPVHLRKMTIVHSDYLKDGMERKVRKERSSQ